MFSWALCVLIATLLHHNSSFFFWFLNILFGSLCFMDQGYEFERLFRDLN